MSEELNQALSKLKLEQLKDLAERYGIDCSSCEGREEYIDAISDSQKVTGEDLESLYGSDTTGFEGEPEPELDAAEKLLQETKSTFENRDYITAIVKATEAIEAGTKALNAFYGIGLSYAIRSSENMITELKDLDIDTSSAEEILSSAIQSYENKEYDTAGSIIRELKDALNELYNQQAEKSSELIDKVQALIDKAGGIGADVEEAQAKLQHARELEEKESTMEALSVIRESEMIAKTAYENRLQEISDKISQAEKAIEDARYLNAPVSEAEEMLENARTDFDSEEYASAIEKAEKAMQLAEDSKNEQIQKVLRVQERMKASVPMAAAEVPVEALELEKEEIIEEKPAPAKKAKVCPTCGGEPTYVEQYQRYYCYTCNAYIEPVEKGMEKKAEAVAEPAKKVKVCPTCGGEPTYVEQYQRYYCYTCNAYVEPVERGIKKKAEVVAEPTKKARICPTCGGEPTYVEQYQRYYCYTCNAYVEPVERGIKKKAEVVAEPAKKAKVCPTCGGEPTYVEQYRRYYCYTCNAYIEPTEKTAKPAPSANTCPTCGREATFVAQYNRYYCYTCNKYL